MDKLHFLTAGIPSNAKDYTNAFNKLEEMNLEGKRSSLRPPR